MSRDNLPNIFIVKVRGKDLKLEASDEGINEGIKVEYDGISKLLKGYCTVERIAEELSLNKDELESVGPWLDKQHRRRHRELKDKCKEDRERARGYTERLSALKDKGAENSEEYKRLMEEFVRFRDDAMDRLHKIADCYFGNRFCYECKKEYSNLIEHIAKKHLGEQLGRDIITAIMNNLDALYPQNDNGITVNIKDDEKKINEEEVIELKHLSNIEDPKYDDKIVKVEGIVASNYDSYKIPKTIFLKEGKIKDEGGKYKPQSNIEIIEIDSSDPVNIEFINTHKLSLDTKVRELVKLHGKSSLGDDFRDPIYEIITYRRIYRLLLKPIINTHDNNDGNNVHKSYETFIVSDNQLNLEPGKVIRLEGRIVANPKNQRVCLLAYKVEEIDDIKYDTNNLRKLREKHNDKDVNEIANWIIDNFLKYAKIVDRDNLAVATLLAYFTPLYFKFDGEIQRGWANICIYGDTTTGKSKIVSKAIELLNQGMMITGESTTVAGLIGGATQNDKGNWFVEWGLLPLCDKRLLAVDAFNKLSKGEIAELAEAERSGFVEINKIAKHKAYARTRLIKIANPLDKEARGFTTKPLNEFIYPVKALPTIMDSISIARLDLAVASNKDDVKSEDINKDLDVEYDNDLLLLRDVIRWIWSLNDEQIEFTNDARELIYRYAEEMIGKYDTEDIPLVSRDFKYKLARLSIALASLTLSTDEEFSKVIVDKEHVEYVKNFIDNEYSNVGLDKYASDTRDGITLDDAKSIIANLCSEVESKAGIDRDETIKILKYITNKERFTSDDLQTKFALVEKNVLRPLRSILKDEELIKQTNGGFVVTSKMIQIYKKLRGVIFD